MHREVLEEIKAEKHAGKVQEMREKLIEAKTNLWDRAALWFKINALWRWNKMLDIKQVEKEAKKEIADEQMKAAKEELKAKLKALDNAKAVVRNIEREIEDLYVRLGE